MNRKTDPEEVFKSLTMKDKYVKVSEAFLFELQDLIITSTNSPLISIGLHCACKKFIKEIETIPLSEELQTRQNLYER